MKADDPILQELGTLLATLVDAGLPADQRARLNELLRDNPEAKRFYHRYIELHAMLEWESGVVATHHTEADTDTLNDLLRMETQAHAELVHHLGQLRSHNDSPWHPAGALRWIIQRPTTLAGIAAVLALALILIVTLTGNNAPPPITNNTLEPNKPSASTESTPRGSTTATTPVATLTNTHNAIWAEGASAPGSAPRTGDALAAGQRLNLTAGFAEITTARGAIAILEAPATIELLDNHNALHLHTGKLVGICETPSSKGFLVRTPHMDITDLGTRFGVHADRRVTQVHVFEGVVKAIRPDAPADTEATLLTAHQSARSSVDNDTITSIDHNTAPFAAILPGSLQLPGTGQDLSLGDTDPNWQIVAIDGKPLDEPQALKVVVNKSYTKHFLNEPAISQWLNWVPPTYAPYGDFIPYTFQTHITLPLDLDPAMVRLRLRYIADNAVAAIVINGQRIEIADPLLNGDYDRWSDFIIDEQLVPGINTIELEVQNHTIWENTTSPDPVGLRAEWELEKSQLKRTSQGILSGD